MAVGMDYKSFNGGVRMEHYEITIVGAGLAASPQHED